MTSFRAVFGKLFGLMILIVNAHSFPIYGGSEEKVSNESDPLCRILLAEAGHVWGTFHCDQCNQTTRAHPNIQDRQACPNCGKPAEKEQYSPPEIRKVGDRQWVYFRESERKYVLGSKDDADEAFSGEPWICDRCGSSNFRNHGFCGGCGNSRESALEAAANAAKSKSKSKGTSSSGGISSPVRDPFTQSDSEDLPRIKPSSSGRGLLWGAAVGLSLFAASPFIYFHARAPYHLEGQVTQIGDTVTIRYQDKKGRAQEIQADGGSLKKPLQLGEVVEIHFRNWGGARGVERKNSEVLQPK